MNTGKSSHDTLHLLGVSATHPNEPRCGALAALLLLAAITSNAFFTEMH